MSGGAIRRKQKKSLEKSILLREFITDTKPGRPVALMVCTNRGGDGMMTTCCSVLDEAAFSLLVKNAFSTRMTCMLQEYVVGESKADRAWRVSAVPDPRVDGQGWLEASWSPGCLQVTLRAETELAAVSHQVVESTQADSHAMSRPRIILYPRKDNKVAADAGVSDVAGGGQKKRELEADGLRLHIGISSKADLFDRGRSELFRRFVGDCKHEYARAVRAEGHAFKRYPDVASGRISAPAILLEDKDRRSDTKNSGGRPGHDSNRQHPHPNHDKLMEPRRPQRWQSVYAQHESIAQRVLVREAFGGLDYYQNGLGAVIGLKERQQVMAMCEHMSQLVPRAYVHSNAGDEHPHLRRLLAYFKRSCKGKLYMIWCSMGVHVPSETAQAHARVGRTINSDLAGIRELLQNLVLSPGWYTKYCLLEEDEDKGLIKAFDSRATTMDIYEFVALLVKINLIPTRLSKKHAASVFRKANRDEDAGDSDVFQMNFQEFRVGIRLVAEALGIDNHAMDSAMRFGDVLSNPNAFPRFARAAKDAMQFYEFYTLLLTFRITPFFVSKDAAEQEFRKVVKIEKERAKERGLGGAGAAGAAEDGSASPPAAVNSKNAGGNRIMGLSLEAYREVMMRLAASLSLHLRMDDDGERVCVNSSYSEKILGGSFPPREKREKLIDRLLKTTSVKGANKADKGPKSDNKSPKNGRDGRPRGGDAVSPAGSPVSPEEPDEASQSPEAAKAAAQNGKQGSPGGRFRQDGPSKDRATGGANLMDKAVTKTQVTGIVRVRVRVRVRACVNKSRYIAYRHKQKRPHQYDVV